MPIIDSAKTASDDKAIVPDRACFGLIRKGLYRLNTQQAHEVSLLLVQRCDLNESKVPAPGLVRSRALLEGARSRHLRRRGGGRLAAAASADLRPAGYVGPALVAEAGAEAHQRRVRGDLARGQRLALAEGGGPVDQAGWHEGKHARHV